MVEPMVYSKIHPCVVKLERWKDVKDTEVNNEVPKSCDTNAKMLSENKNRKRRNFSCSNEASTSKSQNYLYETCVPMSSEETCHVGFNDAEISKIRKKCQEVEDCFVAYYNISSEPCCTFYDTEPFTPNRELEVSLPTSSEIKYSGITTFNETTFYDHIGHLKDQLSNKIEIKSVSNEFKTENGSGFASRRQLFFSPVENESKCRSTKFENMSTVSEIRMIEPREKKIEATCSTPMTDDVHSDIPESVSPLVNYNDMYLGDSPFGHYQEFSIVGTLCKKASQIHTLCAFSEKFSGMYTSSFTESTTHVVVKTKSCQKTFKILMGIASKIYVVKYEWVERSLNAGKLLPVGDFMFNEGSRRCLTDIPPPFCNTMFFLHSSLSSSTLAFEKLLKATGATVKRKITDLYKQRGKLKFLVYSNLDLDDIDTNLLIEHRIAPVSVNWVIESIYCYKKISIEPHLSPYYPIDLVPTIL